MGRLVCPCRQLAQYLLLYQAPLFSLLWWYFFLRPVWSDPLWFNLAQYSEPGTIGRLVCPTINWHSNCCATMHHRSSLVLVYICIQSDQFILSGFDLAQIWMEPGTTGRLVCPLVVGLILGWISIGLRGLLATGILLPLPSRYNMIKFRNHSIDRISECFGNS
jgi:hypothetical protein